MQNADNAYRAILHDVLRYGEDRSDRTGVGTLSLFGQQLEVVNSVSFPAITIKKLNFDQVAAELAAFLAGATTLEEFHAFGCKIWDGNAQGRNRLGPIYGAQWRRWPNRFGSIDQLGNMVRSLRCDPESRRHFVSAWNVAELPDMCLPPCHVSFQAYVSRKQFLDIHVYQRSVDLFLGLPFDIASYALLQRIIAQEVGLISGRLIFSFGDSHIYKNHLEQVELILSRNQYPPPQLELDEYVGIDNFHPKMARLIGYQHGGFVKGELNV